MYGLQPSAKHAMPRLTAAVQFHNGIGVPFGADYTQKQKQAAKQAGRIFPTGCPEM